MKHLEVMLYWIRDEVAKGTIDFNWVNTKDQLADIGTKPYYSAQFIALRYRIMGYSSTVSGGVLEESNL
jgi:hypothetical protein